MTDTSKQSLFSFREAFAAALVTTYAHRAQQNIIAGDVFDIEGNSVRVYALEAADGYYNDLDMWDYENNADNGRELLAPTIDAQSCAELDLEEWEWEE